MMNEPPTYLDSLTRLSYEIPDSLSDIVFELFDASGRIILQEHIRHTVQRIYTTGLSGGLYYYRALSAGVLNGKGLLILDKSK